MWEIAMFKGAHTQHKGSFKSYNIFERHEKRICGSKPAGPLGLSLLMISDRRYHCIINYF